MNKKKVEGKLNLTSSYPIFHEKLYLFENLMFKRCSNKLLILSFILHLQIISTYFKVTLVFLETRIS